MRADTPRIFREQRAFRIAKKSLAISALRPCSFGGGVLRIGHIMDFGSINEVMPLMSCCSVLGVQACHLAAPLTIVPCAPAEYGT